MRIFWLQIFLIFAPFFLYRIYVVFVTRRKMETGGAWNEGPLTMLFVIGLLLSIISFIVMGATGDRVTEGDYTPATLEDGKIIPPHLDE